MNSNGLAHFADALMFVHGAHAPAEAALHAILAEKSGDTEMAAMWRDLQFHLVKPTLAGCRQAA